MKLKIISDGTANGTKLINAESGEILENVKSVKWFCDTGDYRISRVVIEIVNVPTEIIGYTGIPGDMLKI